MLVKAVLVNQKSQTNRLRWFAT